MLIIHKERLNQAVCIKRSIRHAGIMRIPQKIIHPVNIQVPMDNRRKPMCTGNNSGNLADITADFLQMRLDNIGKRQNIIVRKLPVLSAKPLGSMRIRAVTYVMQKSRRTDHKPFIVCKVNRFADLIRQGHCP